MSMAPEARIPRGILTLEPPPGERKRWRPNLESPEDSRRSHLPQGGGIAGARGSNPKRIPDARSSPRRAQTGSAGWRLPTPRGSVAPEARIPRRFLALEAPPGERNLLVVVRKEQWKSLSRSAVSAIQNGPISSIGNSTFDAVSPEIRNPKGFLALEAPPGERKLVVRCDASRPPEGRWRPRLESPEDSWHSKPLPRGA